MNQMSLKMSDLMKVDFSHQPEKNGYFVNFKGIGVSDLVEDGRIFGRIENGKPFCCLVTDVETLDLETSEIKPKSYPKMMKLRSVYVKGIRTSETKQANKIYWFDNKKIQKKHGHTKKSFKKGGVYK